MSERWKWFAMVVDRQAAVREDDSGTSVSDERFGLDETSKGFCDAFFRSGPNPTKVLMVWGRVAAMSSGVPDPCNIRPDRCGRVHRGTGEAEWSWRQRDTGPKVQE